MKGCKDTKHTHTHQKSHENISTIKAQQSQRTAVPQAGETEINRLLSREAVQHVTRPTAWKQLGGRDGGFRQKQGSKRDKAGTKTRLASKTNTRYKLVSGQRRGLQQHAVWVCVIACVTRTEGGRYAGSCFNTVVENRGCGSGCRVIAGVSTTWPCRAEMGNDTDSQLLPLSVQSVSFCHLLSPLH